MTELLAGLADRWWAWSAPVTAQVAVLGLLVLALDALLAYEKKATGEKFLIEPQKA